MKKLKEKFENICEEYLRKFCYKHGYEDYGEWVDMGNIALVGDMYVDFNDIRYDIDHEIDEEKFENWHWKDTDRRLDGLQYMNYRSFCLGAPDPIYK